MSSYNIDRGILEGEASSWTENTNIVWRHLGIKYVRDKNNNILENSGQIVQKYLFEREVEGFTFTFQGKDVQRKEHVRGGTLNVLIPL